MAKRTNPSALTACEAEIMELFDDEHMGADAIATRTGLRKSYVENIIQRYRLTERTLNSFDQMTKAGSESLLAAIQRHHPNFEALL